MLEDGQFIVRGKSKPFRKENILNVLFQCFIKKDFAKLFLTDSLESLV